VYPAITHFCLLLRTEKPPEGPEWLIELKLDGYRAQAIKSGGRSSSVLAMATPSTPGSIGSMNEALAFFYVGTWDRTATFRRELAADNDRQQA
jgi:hypothetical protein